MPVYRWDYLFTYSASRHAGGGLASMAFAVSDGVQDQLYTQ